MPKQIEQIRKRDGRIVPFQESRIKDVIAKAAAEVQEMSEKDVERTAAEVNKALYDQYDGNTIQGVEEVQDVVVAKMLAGGFHKTARAYMIYRQRHKEMRLMRQPLTEVMEVSDLADNSLVVLKKRYLLKDDNGEVVETPTDMFKRVATNIALADETYKNLYHQDVNVAKTAAEFYEVMAKL